MMSVERSFEAWEEVQRHGQDLADKLTQGFTGLIQSHITPPTFAWPNPPTPKLFEVEFPTQSFMKNDFGLSLDKSTINGVTAIFDVGNRIGQAGADFGASFNGGVQQFFRRLPLPFRHEESAGVSLVAEGHGRRAESMGISLQEDLGSLAERFKDYGIPENGAAVVEGSTEDDTLAVTAKALKKLGRAQLGPVLFVRDSTLLLPVHLSKQHLLWYGYDRKNGMHSLCPAVWSKHRRWLLMSMICLNPFACSFMDVQFPNGQVTYVSGEGISTSAFLPLCGGLIQAQGQYPGEMKLSFSCKNKWGTRVTPTWQWPDKSFALRLEQALAWKRSGLMVRPTVQLSLCPTFGGCCPGVHMEVTHSVKDELNLSCGCALVNHPSAFASASVGRSKWNGNVGSAGVVLKVETPLDHFGRPSFSVQATCAHCRFSCT
ncbi:uncharacterized protein LOC125213885 isoform X2 [Salvia hispanica]|uniref:uncharacterized protein LOC125213885 isoform X2 n=1 Tax=Salvia hispanica TaxID=49212 RepID=UPI002009B758|nr:uncharacterized protein LOC125213885 isoform X2 [Salvia hispanica]